LDQTYSKGLPPSGATNDPFGRLKFSRDPAQFHDAKVEREESVPFEGQQTPCYVVHALYNYMPGNPGASDVTRTVWIAKANGQILRDTWDSTSTLAGSLSPNRVHLTTAYSVIECGRLVADDLFICVYAARGQPRVEAADWIRWTKTARPAGAGSRSQTRVSAEARAAGLQGTISLYVEV
jgi:hypothetical protein